MLSIKLSIQNLKKWLHDVVVVVRLLENNHEVPFWEIVGEQWIASYNFMKEHNALIFNKFPEAENALDMLFSASPSFDYDQSNYVPDFLTWAQKVKDNLILILEANGEEMDEME